MKQFRPIEPIPSESIFKKVVQGGIWVFALRIINRGLGFVRTIILARLLSPADFGILGIAMLAISTLETFSRTGFREALIQKKGNVERYLDTAWTVLAIRGIVLFLILFLSAPLVSRFFQSPQAYIVIQIIAINSLISGFGNIGILFFEKELEFNKQFFYMISTTVVDLSVALILAFILRNVWALVWGGLAGNIARTILSYVIHPYRPHIRFNNDEFRHLFQFGKWLFGAAILNFLLIKGDDIFVGKMLGATALAFYQMAYLLSNLPATEITFVIEQVTFPAYSKFQSDLPRLRESYLRVLQLTVFMSIPIAGGIFILTPEFTKIFLGSKWMPIVSTMQILCIYGMIRSFSTTTSACLKAMGSPHILTRLYFLQLLLLAVIIYPLTVNWGLIGVAISVVIPLVLTQLIGICMLMKMISLGALPFIRRLLFPFIGTSIMIVSLFFLKHVYANDLLIFIVSIISGSIIYLAVIFLLDRIYNFNYKEMIEGLIHP